MDFTLLNDSIPNDEIYIQCNSMLKLIEEETRLKLKIDEESKETHLATGNTKFYPDYIGPLGGKGDHVKVDVTRKEKLEFKAVWGNVMHDYSDLIDAFTIISYDLREITIEKMVALMDRTISRDLYDFDFLTSVAQIDLKDIYLEFESKAKNRGLSPKDFMEKVSDKEPVFKKAWDVSLHHQIKELPKFDDVWRDIRKQFRIIGKIN